jgi:sulfur carrier protein
VSILINGEERTLEGTGISILDLLKANGVESVEMVSVQRNGEFVDRSEYASTFASENDEIDFLYFMGGGER